MANQAEAKASNLDAKAAARPKDDGLIEVRKDGEVLRVHPSCVVAHEKAGWVQ